MFAFYRFMYDVVGFSRSQSNGFLIFLPVAFCILFSRPFVRAINSQTAVASADDIRRLDSLIALWPAKDTSRAIVAMESFNPNTADFGVLEKLGLNAQLCRRIINYRTKGGQFRIKRDLLKIHGLDSADFQRLEPYILLPLEFKRPHFARSSDKPKQSKIQDKFDLNEADTIQFQSVYGIGQRLALRIWKYREALGGFINQAQVFEVYKLDSAVAKRLISRSFIKKDFMPTQHDLNSSVKEQLSAHPYLTRRMADVIVAYRFQHGNFQSIDDLRKLPGFDSVTYRKIRPYITVEKK